MRARALRLAAPPWRGARAFDWALLGAVLTAIAFGMAMIYSATLRSSVTSAWDDLVIKQIAFSAAGLLLLALLAATEYRVLVTFWPWLYAGTVGALGLLLFVGRVSLGSQRWFSAGLVDVQPSEFAKLAVILCLAAYFERYDVRRFRHVVGSLGLVAVPMALVLLQPNLSTALLLGAIWVGVVFAAGIRPLHLSFLALLGTPALLVVLNAGLVQRYMIGRISAWLDPLADPSGAGFQNIQTLIAVGNGQLTGTGYATGLQTQGGWLPLIYTDNIFALVAEELGFVGAVAILAVLGFIVWRILRAASLAQDRAGALIAVGVATYLLVQTFVNVGVVLQLLPVTGVSLPFVSYGGSSLAALLAGIGLVQSVLVRRKPLAFR